MFNTNIPASHESIINGEKTIKLEAYYKLITSNINYFYLINM